MIILYYFGYSQHASQQKKILDFCLKTIRVKKISVKKIRVKKFRVKTSHDISIIKFCSKMSNQIFPEFGRKNCILPIDNLCILEWRDNANRTVAYKNFTFTFFLSNNVGKCCIVRQQATIDN